MFDITSLAYALSEGLAMSKTQYTVENTKYFQFTLNNDQKYLALSVN